MPIAKSMRYAHSDGHTDVCFDSSGRYILTCGCDGDVRIWKGIDDDNAISHRVGDKAYAIAFKNDRFFVATDTNNVQAYTFPDGAPDGILTRFTAMISHMVLNSAGTKLVAGSGDFSVKIVEVSSCSHKVCSGHEAPILSLALDPKEEFLASSSCDGSVRIWSMSDQKQIHSWSLLPKSNDVSLSKTLCRLCWDSTGQHLFIPVDKEIHIYERSTWKKVESFTEESVSEMISVLALSPDGLCLAAASYNGWIYFFDVKSRKCVDRFKHEQGLQSTAMAWNPKGNKELAYCDKEGQLGLLEDISTRKNSQSKVPQGVFEDEDDDFLIEASNAPATEDGDKSDNEENASLSRSPKTNDDDNDSLAGQKKLDSEVDDDDAASSVSERLVLPKPEIKNDWFPQTLLQRAFQPGSTPEHLTSRFMVWNSVGIIQQYNSDEENSINIEFHDTTVHHAMHISNIMNYSMADLSMEAVLLASECDGDNPSKLMCMHFGSWDSNKEWTVSMPDEEEIQAITLGEGWVAVATDKRNVRLFTISGIQRDILSISGPVVCMAAHGNQLVVIYHSGMGLPGDQCLAVSLLYVDGKQRSVLKGEPLPISSKAKISWAGFSSEGTPIYMDTAGIVRMLNRKFGLTWIQVANTRSYAKGKLDYYFIVGVNENPQQLRCILCKGARYPATLPHPAVTVLPFQLPLCELNTEKSQYEEALWRGKIFSNHFDHWTNQGFEYDETIKSEAHKPVQEALMKLFALSARSDREFRALEVCDMMSDQHTLQLAIKYASRLRHMQLAQRISELAVRKAEEEMEPEVEELEELEIQPPQRSKAWNKRIGDEESVDQKLEEGEEVEERGDVDMQEEEEDVENKPAGPMLSVKVKNQNPLSSKPPSSFLGRSNPFKIATGNPGVTSVKGTQVFDSMTKKKPEKTAVSILGGLPGKESKQTKGQKKVSSQPKLFETKKKDLENQTVQQKDKRTLSAFDLWLEANVDHLKSDKPELDEEELTKYAAELFRTLDKEERQEWLKKARAAKSEQNEPPEGNENKRKLKDTEIVDADEKETKKLHLVSPSAEAHNKKPLLQNTKSTNAKLANFRFFKE
ncbi:hypothetical protein CHS0354_024221 [Potamilus streckersoni]|uniref:HMG box domain-containing protein n=1 Tax=Potamilus streckersoni TaxID=2493646 RepID=A0AAE0SBZ6_9BIVA|nr:hypothetical protein CHS0354_024221 [Potamilus streckersoni]